MSDNLDRACRWVSKQYDANTLGVEIHDVETDAPDKIDYADMTYPYLRAATMRLAEERELLEYSDV